MAKKAPTTQLSMKHLRAMGFYAERVEHYDAYARRSNDMLGVFDIFAMRENEGLVGVQTTTRDHYADRRRKILGSREAELWCSEGGRIFLHGWYKQGRFWQLKEEEISHDRFARDQDERGDGTPEDPLS